MSYFVSPPFCIFSFCWEEFLNYSWVLLSQSLWTSFSVIFCAIERSRERPLRASAASCLWVLLLSTAASPFSILLSPYRQIDLPSSQCPCSVIWFEEFLMGSYKVVLCPRSGEGYFGLARRTYSLQCLPDIAAVRLNRFTFRFCSKTIPNWSSWALRCRSRERSMALPQLPAHALNQLV